MFDFTFYPKSHIDQLYSSNNVNTWKPIYFALGSIMPSGAIIDSRYVISVPDRVSRPWTKENRYLKGFDNIKNKAKPSKILLFLISNL